MPDHDGRNARSLVFSITELGNGDRLAECVDSAGEVGYWLLRPLCERHEVVAEHGSTSESHHDCLGPLPDVYQRRLLRTPLRCGHPRRDGRACRAEVTTIGQACHHHSASARTAPDSVDGTAA
jgi:hypothetical protein